MKVAPITAPAARYAVEHWHYSRTMPMGRSVYFGVWDGDPETYVGAVIFGRGASPYLGRATGLSIMQICELTRVALREHVAPVSQIVTEAVRLLRQTSPGLRLIVSFADPYRDHHGGIYQAMNWLYLGLSAPTTAYRMRDGVVKHAREVHRGGYNPDKLLHNRVVTRTGFVRQFGKTTRGVARAEDCEKVEMPGKHRYALPLDRAMRRQLLPLVEPYPKRGDE